MEQSNVFRLKREGGILQEKVTSSSVSLRKWVGVYLSKMKLAFYQAKTLALVD